MAKSAKGHYARERDAKAAARAKGLKDDEFEIVDGPKGYTYREKRKYVPVPDAKMHVGKDPDATIEPLMEEVGIHLFREKSTNRFRYSDETEGLSQESFETLAEAEAALTRYAKSLDVTPAQKLSPTSEQIATAAEAEIEKKYAWPTPILPHGSLDAAKAIGVHQKLVELEKLVNEAEIVGKAACPKCKSIVPIAETRPDEHRFTGHGDPATDEDCEESLEIYTGTVDPLVAPKAPWQQNGIPTNQFKPHELAKIQGTAMHAEVHSKPGVVPRITKSTIENPSKHVWAVADEMIATNPAITRKEVIAECIRQGVATFTARTQYQQWSVARRESIAHAAETNKK